VTSQIEKKEIAGRLEDGQARFPCCQVDRPGLLKNLGQRGHESMRVRCRINRVKDRPWPAYWPSGTIW
jgi:hypothetical protein